MLAIRKVTVGLASYWAYVKVVVVYPYSYGPKDLQAEDDIPAISPVNYVNLTLPKSALFTAQNFILTPKVFNIESAP